MSEITYTMSLDCIDWAELKSTLQSDRFDNERTPAQYRLSAENSFLNCFAMSDGRVIGTVRVLSDGVCNAYIVDAWTLSAFRRRGIASRMMALVLEQLQGQHVYLFSDDAVPLYEKLGFQAQGTGLGKVVGEWLANSTREAQ